MLTMKKNPSLKPFSVEEQMTWISIVFTFRLLESWSREQDENAVIFDSKTQYLVIVL